jgi:hypothetical protein
MYHNEGAMKSVYRLAHGKIYYPFIDRDGNFVLSQCGFGSHERYAESYVLEPDPQKFVALVSTRRYHVRMKPPGASASMISPNSIEIEQTSRYLTPKQLKDDWTREFVIKLLESELRRSLTEDERSRLEIDLSGSEPRIAFRQPQKTRRKI